MKLDCGQSVLLIIDVQQRLFAVMDGQDELLAAVVKLIKGARALEIPVILTEQYPEGLGPTNPAISELIPDIKAFEKRSFSCCLDENFMKALEKTKRKQVLVSGMEAHICVYQTCIDLLKAGYEVYLVADAVSSRKESDKELAIRVLEREGVQLRSVEMALFELIKTSRHEKFRAISKIIK